MGIIDHFGFGLPILGFLTYAYFRGSMEFKRATQWLGFWIVSLGFFGIFFDLLHVALPTGGRTGFAFGLVEDGGEMLVLSILVVFIFYNHRCAGRIESSPLDLLEIKPTNG